MINQFEANGNSKFGKVCSCLSNYFQRGKLIKQQDALNDQVELVKELIERELEKWRSNIEDELRVVIRQYKRKLQEMLMFDLHFELEN